MSIKESRYKYTKSFREKNPDYLVKKRLERKKRAVEYLGGSCKHCGLITDEYCVYDFHHINESEKDYKPSDMMSRNKWETIQTELDKCILLCSNCHRIVHFKNKFKDVI